MRKLLFNEPSWLGKRVDSRASALWLGRRKRRPSLDGLNCLVQSLFFPESNYSWVSENLEASMPTQRMQNHILLCTCSLQAQVLVFCSSSVITFTLPTEEPHTWAAVEQGEWSLKSIIWSCSPCVVFYLVLCKQNVLVLNACLWGFIRDFKVCCLWIKLSSIITYIYCRILQIMLLDKIKTEVYLSKERRTYCSVYYTFFTCICSLSTTFWISVGLPIVSVNKNLLMLLWKL